MEAEEKTGNGGRLELSGALKPDAVELIVLNVNDRFLFSFPACRVQDVCSPRGGRNVLTQQQPFQMAFID